MNRTNMNQRSKTAIKPPPTAVSPRGSGLFPWGNHKMANGKMLGEVWEKYGIVTVLGFDHISWWDNCNSLSCTLFFGGDCLVPSACQMVGFWDRALYHIILCIPLSTRLSKRLMSPLSPKSPYPPLIISRWFFHFNFDYRRGQAIDGAISALLLVEIQWKMPHFL